MPQWKSMSPGICPTSAASAARHASIASLVVSGLGLSRRMWRTMRLRYTIALSLTRPGPTGSLLGMQRVLQLGVVWALCACGGPVDVAEPDAGAGQLASDRDADGLCDATERD